MIGIAIIVGVGLIWGVKAAGVLLLAWAALSLVVALS